MPLAVQALLPPITLMGTALVVRLRRHRERNGWIACAGTALAALITLIELVRLSPGEHVDVPYLTTFPYAPIAIRLDGLSLAFATMMLVTAALLMLARLRLKGDRRDPWFSWLLTSAAAGGVMLADNLLLLYIALQVLTLAWSGALDETAPRWRGLRLGVQVADIGLLLAAASAIQSVGTSAFSGVPSDTFGPAAFLLILLPVVVRLIALASAGAAPQGRVSFEPAIAWVAPAGYLFLRLLSLNGGRLPNRTTAAALFVGGVLAVVALAALAWNEPTGPRFKALLVAAQAGLALAFSASTAQVLTVTATWLWLLLIPLAGVIGVSVAGASLSRALVLVNLAIIPGSPAFVGLWLGALALSAGRPLASLVGVALAIVLTAAAALSRVEPVQRFRLDVAGAWAAGLLLVAAFPIVFMSPLVIPAAATVRVVPAGTMVTGPFGLSSPAGRWPALIVSILVGIALVMAHVRLRDRLPLRTPGRPAAALAGFDLPSVPGPFSPPAWIRVVPWVAFTALAGAVLFWP